MQFRESVLSGDLMFTTNREQLGYFYRPLSPLLLISVSESILKVTKQLLVYDNSSITINYPHLSQGRKFVTTGGFMT